MVSKSPAMVRRVAAAQAVHDRFVGAVLDYRRHDCGRLAGMALRLLGHNPRMSRFAGYSNEIGARRRLKAAGFDDLPAVLDALDLERIPMLMVLPGDILGVPGEGGWTALAVALGNGRALAFAPDGVCRVGQLVDVAAATAWRVPPKSQA